MRHDASNDVATGTVITEIETEYDAARARVEAALRRMRAIEAAGHAPADARAASDELAVALREATVTVSLALRLLDARAPAAHRRLRGRPKATRSVPSDVAAWSSELVRLTQIGVWLRRVTLDDLGVHVPKTVRVANYAATGPHIPGVDFGSPAVADARGPLIGIDLPAVIDGVGPPTVPSRQTHSSVVANTVTEKSAAAPRAT